MIYDNERKKRIIECIDETISYIKNDNDLHNAKYTIYHCVCNVMQYQYDNIEKLNDNQLNDLRMFSTLSNELCECSIRDDIQMCLHISKTMRHIIK